MSKFSFAQDINSLKYLPTSYIKILANKHSITIEEAKEVIKDLRRRK